MSNDDKPRINITQTATGSQNVTQIGQHTGDLHIGDRNDYSTHGDTYSGDFSGAILNVRSKLDNVTQTIGAISGADAAAKAELARLVDELKAELSKIPDENAEDAETVTDMVEDLTEKASQKKSRRTLEITGEGLKKAADNLLAVAPTVAQIAAKIVTAILALGA